MNAVIVLCVFSELVHHREPFAHTRIGVVDDVLLVALDRAWTDAAPWVRYDSFYRCWIADVTSSVEVPQSLTHAVAEMVGQPLAPRVRVTLQRMGPGDGATVHTDRPLLGYESVRVVVQLTEDWAPEAGGAFALCAADGSVFDRVAPRRGTAVAFALHGEAHHAVEDCARERRTAVLHFWHRGNRPRLRDGLAALLDGASFAELPVSLHPAMDEAEATLSEADTLRMGTAALLAHRLGLPESELGSAYVGEGSRDADLLHWFAGLWTGGVFDVARWNALETPSRFASPELKSLCALGGW